MREDLQSSPEFEEALRLFEAMRRPGGLEISDAADIHVSPSGDKLVFAGTTLDDLEKPFRTRLFRTSCPTGETTPLTSGLNSDRHPRYSPDGRWLAYLSDCDRAGDFQLQLLDLAGGPPRNLRVESGWVEYLDWSPDGRRILLGVAGHGADVASGQGAVSTSRKAERPTWMPKVETGGEAHQWRRAWVYDLKAQTLAQVSPEDMNVWEAAWAGPDALVAVVSTGPSEGVWYEAALALVDLERNLTRTLYEPAVQLGVPRGAPDGRHAAVVEAVCSDRGIVAGDLRLIELGSGVVRQLDTRAVDISWLEWRSPHTLLAAGHRGAETVVGVYDLRTDQFREVWRDDRITGAGRYVSVAGIGDRGDFAFVAEGFDRAPELAVVRDGALKTVRSFAPDIAADAGVLGGVEDLTWTAPDGRQVQGWLLLPKRPGPHPVVLDIHGGPVLHWRPRWLGRTGLSTLMLLRRGYAILLPNPRGSAGFGQAFARAVLGDMGGADAADCLAGLDDLVFRGLADPSRLGVTGVSYGGFMAAWLITQDRRFAASAPIAPIANHVTEHLVSNIPHFSAIFLKDSYLNRQGAYYERSPILHAHQTRTPTLLICGALDRCTPPEEARQFHNALLENGVETVLVTYPEEGHGVRGPAAMVDCAARIVKWFERHMPPHDIGD